MKPYRAIPIELFKKDFVYGWYIKNRNVCYIFDCNHHGSFLGGFIEVIPETVGQATGLKDKNGKEIYPGDYLHIWSTFYEKDMPIAEVFWNEKCASFDIKVSDGRYHKWLAMGHHKGWFVEIIGNVHQLELIKK